MELHALPVTDALARLDSAEAGLSAAEAAARLARDGPNVLHAARPTPIWKVLLGQLRSVVVLLLVVAAVGAALLGDTIEAASIAAVLLLNTLVGFITELRARRAMEALLRFEVSSAVVLRDGRSGTVDSRTLVTGDILILEPGQRVPADARLLQAIELRADEAPITGESLPVDKTPEPVTRDAALPDRTNMIYKGTTIVAGSGRAVIVATGMRSELGRIGRLVQTIHPERTPLEQRLDALGRRLALVAIAAGALVTIVGLLQRVPLVHMVETGLALAIAAVPEGLPAVATIALAVGMRRMARRHALVRRLPAVETLGSVTVICSDKTGTLTAGEMTVTTLALGAREIAVSGVGYEAKGRFTENDRPIEPLDDPHLKLALHITMLANRADVELGEDGWVVRGDPTEAALLVAAQKAGLRRRDLHATHPEVGEVPFSSERMFMATFHHVANDGMIAHLKGAPGQVLERCDKVLTRDGERPLDDGGRRKVLARNDELAGRGLRVLGLASGPAMTTDESALRGLAFVGLAGMIDAPAPGVRDTLQRLREAGIRTVMITGDQRGTAEAIAKSLGIAETFSRVSPEDKLSIVTALQERGEIVAMLGDGVNDAAALKKADVGVAMGIRGTDVARETAAIVLQDDRFTTIGAAVEEGRVIFNNIRKFVFYLFSCNLAEVLVLLAAGIAGWAQPLLPLQILWLNLVTDTFPALALAVEPAEHDVMRRPPRDPDEAILSRRFLGTIAAYALLITVVTLAAFWVGIARHGAGPDAVTMSFATLGLAQGLHLGNARRRGAVLSLPAIFANRWAIAAVLMVIALQVVAVQTPLARVLHAVPLDPRDWLVVSVLAAVPAIVGQLVKRG